MHLDRPDPVDREGDRDEPEAEHRLGPRRVDETVAGSRCEHGPERPVAAADVEPEADPRLPLRIPLVGADAAAPAERLDHVHAGADEQRLRGRGQIGGRKTADGDSLRADAAAGGDPRKHEPTGEGGRRPAHVGDDRVPTAVEREPRPAEDRPGRQVRSDADRLPAEKPAPEEQNSPRVTTLREDDRAAAARLERAHLPACTDNGRSLLAPALRTAVRDDDFARLDVRDVRRPLRPEREHPVLHTARHELCGSGAGGGKSEPEGQRGRPEHGDRA